MKIYSTLPESSISFDNIDIPGFQELIKVDFEELSGCELNVGDALIIDWRVVQSAEIGLRSDYENHLIEWIKRNIKVICDIKLVLVCLNPEELEEMTEAGFLLVNLMAPDLSDAIVNALLSWEKPKLHDLLKKFDIFAKIAHELKRIDDISTIYIPESLDDQIDTSDWTAPTKNELIQMSAQEIAGYVQLSRLNSLFDSFPENISLKIADRDLYVDKDKIEEAFRGRILVLDKIPERRSDWIIVCNIGKWKQIQGTEECEYLINMNGLTTCCSLSPHVTDLEDRDTASPHDESCPLNEANKEESFIHGLEILILSKRSIIKQWTEGYKTTEKPELKTKPPQKKVSRKASHEKPILFIDDKDSKFNAFSKTWKSKKKSDVLWCNSYGAWREIADVILNDKNTILNEYEAILIDIIIHVSVEDKKAMLKSGLKEYFPKNYALEHINAGQLIVAEISDFIKRNNLTDYPPIIVQSAEVPANQIDYFLFGEKIFADDFFEIKNYQFEPLAEKLHRWLLKKEELLEWRTIKKYLASGNAEMKEMRDQVIRYTRRSQPILIRGERGTGKSIVERAIFHLFKKDNDIDVIDQELNCAAIAENLLKSSLFGMDKGVTDVPPSLGVLRRLAGFDGSAPPPENGKYNTENDENDDSLYWKANLDFRSNKLRPPTASYHLNQELVDDLEKSVGDKDPELFKTIRDNGNAIDNLEEIKKLLPDLSEKQKMELEEGIKVRYSTEGFLFLDEFHHLPLAEQSSLLRVFQTNPSERFVQPEYAETEYSIENVNFVLASNADLEKIVKDGKLLPDLFDRINTLTLTIPPLRERLGDIPIIGENIINNLMKQEVDLKDSWGKYTPSDALITIRDESAKEENKYHWGSNVRGLEKFLYQLMIMHDKINPITKEAVLKSLAKFHKNESKLLDESKKDEKGIATSEEQNIKLYLESDSWFPQEKSLLFLSHKTWFLKRKDSRIYLFVGKGKSLLNRSGEMKKELGCELPRWLIKPGNRSFNIRLGMVENRSWAAWLLFIHHVGFSQFLNIPTLPNTIKWLHYYLSQDNQQEQDWEISSKDDNLPLEFKKEYRPVRKMVEEFISAQLPNWWNYYEKQIK
jgi:transcriptional regulator with PAS, ATPase and Fis domain